MSEASILRTADALADAVARLYPVPVACAGPLQAYLAARNAQVRKREPDTTPRVAELTLRDGTAYEVSEKQVAHWSRSFPDVEVLQTLVEMDNWLQANPGRRKTRQGVLRFIIGWLNREQNTPRLKDA